MSKFHINPETGNASACRAVGDGCPFGGSDQHYSSKQEAQGAYEQRMETNQGTVSTVRKIKGLAKDQITKKPEINLKGLDLEEKQDLARGTDDSETLSLLADDAIRQGDAEHDQVLVEVVDNRHASAELLNKVAGQLSEWDHEDTQRSLAKNPLVTENNLIHLAEGPSPHTQREMLKNPNLTPGVLDTLADGHMMKFVADHEMTSSDTLAKIAAHIEEYEDEDDQQIRESLAHNPNTPSRIAKPLLADKIIDDFEGEKINDYTINEVTVSDDYETITLHADPNQHWERGDGTNIDAEIEFAERGDFLTLSREDAEKKAEELANQVNTSYTAAYLSGNKSHAADFAEDITNDGYGGRNNLPEGFTYKVAWSGYTGATAEHFMEEWEEENDN